MSRYFSDREQGPRAQTEEEISERVWRGVVRVIRVRIQDGSFGYHFPALCPNPGREVFGTSEFAFNQAVAAEVVPPPDPSEFPGTVAVLDLLEFCHRHIAKPVPAGYHESFRHTHLAFEPKEGQAEFRDDINRIFARNGIAYQLEKNGQVSRLTAEPFRQALASAKFQTGDTVLNQLLETACEKYLNPDLAIRREGLEKLWDAWERLKTIEKGPADKKGKTRALLDRAAAEETFRDVIEQDARALTAVGNDFQIRHTEVGKIPVTDSADVDYFFHRLFSLIRLLLKKTARGG